MQNLWMEFILIAVPVFLITVLAERILIPILKSHKLGQKILDIGPRWHKSKEGTPTMGGLGFILASTVVMFVWILFKALRGESANYIPVAMTFVFAVANGMIGFVDDYLKLIKKENEGLNWKQKIVLQFTVAAAYVAVMSYTHYFPTDWRIPFTSETLSLGWIAYPVAVILLVGVVNGGNLTDGIDGLLSSMTVVIGVYYLILAIFAKSEAILIPASLLIGSALGFLVYNFHPARVFMGDTGSLFIGASVIAVAFQMQDPLMGILVSLPVIFEMLSSFLQFAYFKATHGKRLFKMAPFHHHLEKCGWSENQIVLIFSIVQALMCALAYFSML